MKKMELNADLGEGMGDDEALLAFIDAASIACGGHAGDAASMREALQRCAAAGVRAGAHPSHEDRAHFGRRELPLDAATVQLLVRKQVGLLQGQARELGLRLGHVKPHGALYHQLDREPVLAEAFCATVRELDPALLVLGFAGGELVAAARRLGLRALDEGFADRGYADDGRLLPRDRPGALIENPAEAVAQLQKLAARGVDSVCVHGDSPGALRMARALRQALEASPD